MLFAAGLATAQSREAKESLKVEVPDWLEARIGGLSTEQREFLLSDKAEGFTGTRARLYQRLENKTAEEIQAYVDGMMTVVQSRKFSADTDMASIPLNTEAPDFNSWKVKRPPELGPKREPGSIQLSYYANNRPGIRTFANAPVAIYPEDLIAGFEWMRNNGMRYHTMAEVEKRGWEEVMKRALKEAREGGNKLYVSFDVDVLDPALVPGTGTPVPSGLTMREAMPIVRRLCAENDLVGFEIVELDPLLDSTYRSEGERNSTAVARVSPGVRDKARCVKTREFGEPNDRSFCAARRRHGRPEAAAVGGRFPLTLSALNANYILHACLTGVAMRRTGITDPGFLSELTADHMQPGAGIQGEKDDKHEKVDPLWGTGRRNED